MRIITIVFPNTLIHQSENSTLCIFEMTEYHHNISIVFLRYMADAIEQSEDTEGDTWDYTDTVYDGAEL